MLFKESLEPCLPISHLLAHDFLLAFHQGMGPEKVAQHMKKPYETMVKLGHNPIIYIYIYIIVNIYIYYNMITIDYDFDRVCYYNLIMTKCD